MSHHRKVAYLLEQAEKKRQQKLNVMNPEERKHFLREEEEAMERASKRAAQKRERRALELNVMARQNNSAELFFIAGGAFLIFTVLSMFLK
jgi:hypothetical protein